MDALNDLLPRLEQLNQIGAALSDERDIDRLLENILLAAKAITHADGGTLYRVNEDRQSLHFEIVRTDSLGIAFGGASGQPISAKFKDLPLYRDDGAANDSLIAAYTAINARTVYIADAYAADGFDFSGTRRFDAMTGYRSQSFLTVPLKNHDNEIIGVLQAKGQGAMGQDQDDVVLLPLTLGGRRPGVRMPLPRVGEHSEEILSALKATAA